MPDTKSQFLKRILEEPDEPEKSFASERQLTAQAFNLHVEKRDGRHAEGFAWSHYTGYRWVNEGEIEKLVVVFGTRAIEVEGHQLGILVNEIRDGQLNRIRELATPQRKLLEAANPENEPIIASVRTYPDFDEMLKELKGEDDRDTRHTRRLER